LFGAPLSIQQIKAFICACVMVPLCGILPERMAALMFEFFANTSACVVKGPPELVVPVAWQLLFMEQTDVSIGCTSVENLGLIPAQENVMPTPVPPPGVVVPLLLHAIKNAAEEKINRMITNVFFIK
jgi:hypothetical protein